jgi:hypothetical protein
MFRQVQPQTGAIEISQSDFRNFKKVIERKPRGANTHTVLNDIFLAFLPRSLKKDLKYEKVKQWRMQFMTTFLDKNFDHLRSKREGLTVMIEIACLFIYFLSITMTRQQNSDLKHWFIDCFTRKIADFLQVSYRNHKKPDRTPPLRLAIEMAIKNVICKMLDKKDYQLAMDARLLHYIKARNSVHSRTFIHDFTSELVVGYATEYPHTIFNPSRLTIMRENIFKHYNFWALNISLHYINPCKPGSFFLGGILIALLGIAITALHQRSWAIAGLACFALYLLNPVQRLVNASIPSQRDDEQLGKLLHALSNLDFQFHLIESPHPPRVQDVLNDVTTSAAQSASDQRSEMIGYITLDLPNDKAAQPDQHLTIAKIKVKTRGTPSQQSSSGGGGGKPPARYRLAATHSRQTTHQPRHNKCLFHTVEASDFIMANGKKTDAFYMEYDKFKDHSYETYPYTFRGKQYDNIYKIKRGASRKKDARFIAVYISKKDHPELENCYVMCGYNRKSHTTPQLSPTFLQDMRELALRIARGLYAPTKAHTPGT